MTDSKEDKEDVEYKPLLSAPESDGEEDESPPSVTLQSKTDNGGKMSVGLNSRFIVVS